MTVLLNLENQTFTAAFKAGWIELWGYLPFLPTVGHWFEPERNPRDALNDDDDH